MWRFILLCLQILNSAPALAVWRFIILCLQISNSAAAQGCLVWWYGTELRRHHNDLLCYPITSFAPLYGGMAQNCARHHNDLLCYPITSFAPLYGGMAQKCTGTVFWFAALPNCIFCASLWWYGTELRKHHNDLLCYPITSSAPLYGGVAQNCASTVFLFAALPNYTFCASLFKQFNTNWHDVASQHAM